MHTIMVVAGGLILLLVVVVLARWMVGPAAVATAALYFIPAWLVLALVNLWVGMTRAGYTFMQEAPILIIVFGVPAAAAVFIWWKFSQG